MARRAALLGTSLLLLSVTACADTGEGSPGAPGTTPGAPSAAFETRAERVAQAWRDAAGQNAWRTGFVPLQELTVPPADGTFTDAAKQAFTAGWYRLDVGMPREAANRKGTIRYPDGASATVPLMTLAQAYAELDQGDPPACAGPEIPPPADAPGGAAPGTAAPGGTDQGGPAGSGSEGPPKPCVALTVTGVTLGNVDLLTSRGKAEVPAWLFTVAELKGQVARVAVAASEVTAVPEIAAGELPPVTGLVNAQDVTSAEGTALAYRLGVGACDEAITPLWWEADDVVVVAGTATRREGVCTDQLLLEPARARLAAPLGDRPVLDAGTGQVLKLVPATTR
jgi:hypothetical protein